MGVETWQRRLPIGAEPQSVGGVHFRVWAPLRKRVEVVCQRATAGHHEHDQWTTTLIAEAGGYFAAFDPAAEPGVRYGFRLDGEPGVFPDPASRFQPDGCHGPSEVVDPSTYVWRDDAWPGVQLRGQVIYELHIGTFTREGTWAAAARELPELAALGITVVQVMPVAEFPGRFGWGYDGVDFFAPTRLYGSPDDFRRFVDQAHAVGVGVILDVVYNHLGPDGNFLGLFSADYTSNRHHTDWGAALNFDGPQSGPVREFFTANAGYWVDEFHIDGLRLDATHAILDNSHDHILTAITRSVRQAARGRKTIVIAENEHQEAKLVRAHGVGGHDMDGVLSDDFHHSARVAMSGHNEYYYGDYQGSPQELISAIKWGYLYQGQWNVRQQKRRGTPTRDVPAWQFVVFLQNHDQVANAGRGQRTQILTSPGRHRALTTLLLLGPNTPLLFQGQEFGATAPFLYFADHVQELAKLVRVGRKEGLKQFRSLAGPDSEEFFSDPDDVRTFEQSKLDFSERQRHAEVYQMHRDLLKLRHDDPVFSSQDVEQVHGAILGPEALLLRFFGAAGSDRLILVNLGRDLLFNPAAEPLLAPAENQTWSLLWSSEDPRYGGSGTAVLDTKNWHLPGHAALVLGGIADRSAG